MFTCGPALFGGATGLTDPYFSSTVLLCHFDGANGQTTTVDSSPQAHTLTLGASIALSTSIAKFGSASLNMTAAGSGAVTSADSNDWWFDSGPFTVEAFVYYTAAPSNLTTIASQNGLASSNRGWFFGHSGSTVGFAFSTDGTTSTGFVGATFSPTLNTWYHIAADRDAAGVVRIYVNGAVTASATRSTAAFNSTATLSIGNVAGGVKVTGYIDELRITKGIARYQGTFTPPTAAFPNA
jgi:hypothetical protein